MINDVCYLLEALRGGQSSFDLVEYNDKKNDSDTSKIFKMQRERDVAGLMGFWEKKIDENYFELTHPEKNIKTRAVYSFQHFMANYVFMVDKNGSNPWVIAQSSFLIDMAITEKVIYKNTFSDEKTILPHIYKLADVDPRKLHYDSLCFGFELSNARPYHHFYDQYKFYINFSKKRKVSEKGSFFNEKDNFESSENKNVFVFPNAIGNAYLNQRESSIVKCLNENMELNLYKESVKNKKEGGGHLSQFDLVLWFGITGQKRSWLDQIDGCINIIKYFKSYFKNIFLYIDGMTAMQGKRIANEEDEAIFSEIEQGLSDIDGVAIQSLIGWDYREKIVCCDSADLFIANAGGGCMVPLRFVKKPGVLHSNSKLFTFPDQYPGCVKRVNKNHVVDVVNGKNSAAMNVSYHVPWQHVCNLAAEVLNEIKGINIIKLNVPLVSDVKQAYDKKNEVKAEIDRCFWNLQDRIKINPNSPNILREVAFAFEKAGDVHTAMKVMEKAHFLRPHGPVIKQKLNEYKKAIKDK